MFHEGECRLPEDGGDVRWEPRFDRGWDAILKVPSHHSTTDGIVVEPCGRVDLGVFFSTESRIVRLFPGLGALQVNAFFFEDLA